jgi:hypothetical protein
MKEQDIVKRIAQLEFIHDQLSAEILHLDRLLRSVGFPDGIRSAREVAREIIEAEGKGDENVE